MRTNDPLPKELSDRTCPRCGRGLKVNHVGIVVCVNGKCPWVPTGPEAVVAILRKLPLEAQRRVLDELHNV